MADNEIKEGDTDLLAGVDDKGLVEALLDYIVSLSDRKDEQKVSKMICSFRDGKEWITVEYPRYFINTPWRYFDLRRICADLQASPYHPEFNLQTKG